MKFIGTFVLLWFITFAENANADQSNDYEVTKQSSGFQSSTTASQESSYQQSSTSYQKQENVNQQQTQQTLEEQQNNKQEKRNSTTFSRQGNFSKVQQKDEEHSETKKSFQTSKKKTTKQKEYSNNAGNSDTLNNNNVNEINNSQSEQDEEDATTTYFIDSDESETSTTEDDEIYDVDSESDSPQTSELKSVWITSDQKQKNENQQQTYEEQQINKKEKRNSKTFSRQENFSTVRQNKEQANKINNSQSQQDEEDVTTTYFIDSDVTEISTTEDDEIYDVDNESDSPQSSQPESVWIDDVPDPNTYEVFDIDNDDASQSQPQSKSEELPTTATSSIASSSGVQTTPIRSEPKPAPRPYSPPIQTRPGAKPPIQVNQSSQPLHRPHKLTIARPPSDVSETNTTEDDEIYDIDSESDSTQTSEPESVWTDDVPDPNTYEVFNVDNENTPQSQPQSKSEELPTTATSSSASSSGVQTTPIRSEPKPAPRPYSPPIQTSPGAKPPIQVNQPSQPLDNRPQKPATARPPYDVSETNTSEDDKIYDVGSESDSPQTSQPESVWVEDVPDPNTNEVFDIDNDDATQSQPQSKSVELPTTATLSTASSSGVQTTPIRSEPKPAPRPYSPPIQTTPGAKPPIQVNQSTQPLHRPQKPAIARPPSDVSETNTTEDDEIYDIDSESDSPQTSEPESVWIDDVPDPNTYEVFDIDNDDASQSQPQSKSEELPTTATSSIASSSGVQTTPIRSEPKPAPRPYSPPIQTTPGAKPPVQVNQSTQPLHRPQKPTIARPPSDVSETNTTEDDEIYDIDSESDSPQTSEPESVWTDDEPDPNTYEVFDIDNENTPQSQPQSKSEELPTTATSSSASSSGVQTTPIRSEPKLAPRPYSPPIQTTPGAKPPIQVNQSTQPLHRPKKPAIARPPSDVSETNTSEDDEIYDIDSESDSPQTSEPESVWTDDVPDPNTYEVFDIDNENTPQSQPQSKSEELPTTATSSSASSSGVQTTPIRSEPKPAPRPYSPPIQTTPGAKPPIQVNQPKPVSQPYFSPPIQIITKPVATPPIQPTQPLHGQPQKPVASQPSKHDISTTTTDRVVRGLRQDINIKFLLVDDGSNHGKCSCFCDTDQMPYFVSIDRDKINGYLK